MRYQTVNTYSTHVRTFARRFVDTLRALKVVDERLVLGSSELHGTVTTQPVVAVSVGDGQRGY